MVFELVVSRAQTSVIDMCKKCKYFKGTKEIKKYPNMIVILCDVPPKEWYGEMKCLGERTLRYTLY